MLLYKLALRMGRTVSELSSVMTVDELTHWVAMNARCPIGDERFDYLFAQCCLRMFQAAGIKKSGAPRAPSANDWTLDDFLMFHKQTPAQPKKPPTPREFLEAMLGGRFLKPKPKDLL